MSLEELKTQITQEEEFYTVLIRSFGPDNSFMKLDPISVRKTNSQLEKALLRYVLKRLKGRILLSAALFGITRETLRRKLRDHGIDSTEFGGRVDRRIRSHTVVADVGER